MNNETLKLILSVLRDLDNRISYMEEVGNTSDYSRETLDELEKLIEAS